jgi:hypothetical protein
VATERVHRRRRTVALAAAAALLVVAAALLAILISDRSDTPAISGAPKDVVATVTQFETALAGRDWATICNTLYTSEARASAGGAHCPATLAQSAGGLRQPRVRIVAVVVRGQAASVKVAASVNGRPAVTDTIQLVRERGRFRIASAGGD